MCLFFLLVWSSTHSTVALSVTCIWILLLVNLFFMELLHKSMTGPLILALLCLGWGCCRKVGFLFLLQCILLWWVGVPQLTRMQWQRKPYITMLCARFFDVCIHYEIIVFISISVILHSFYDFRFFLLAILEFELLLIIRIIFLKIV